LFLVFSGLKVISFLGKTKEKMRVISREPRATSHELRAEGKGQGAEGKRQGDIRHSLPGALNARQESGYPVRFVFSVL
jgi:hypothetical protein